MFPLLDTFAHTMRPLCTVGDLSVPAGGLAFITIVMVITTACSAKGLKAYQHSEPGSSPLAEPPSAAEMAPSAPLPSNPSGSHGLLASAAWRGTRAKHWCRGWTGRTGQGRAGGAGRDFLLACSRAAACRMGCKQGCQPCWSLCPAGACQGANPRMVWAHGHRHGGERHRRAGCEANRCKLSHPQPHRSRLGEEQFLGCS